MPYTPYHFGPSGFIALALRKWIDVPVFVLANVVIDLEVLVIGFLHLGRPIHRYCHTLAIGAAVGAIWGFAAYLLLRRPLESLMALVRIRYKAGLAKMIISGALGAALHVLIDAIYHYDVRAFWPNKTSLRRATQYIDRERIVVVCLCFMAVAAVLYVQAVISYRKNAKINKAENENNSTGSSK